MKKPKNSGEIFDSTEKKTDAIRSYDKHEGGEDDEKATVITSRSTDFLRLRLGQGVRVL